MKHTPLFALASALLLTACAGATAAEQTGIIGAGVAGIAAVFDQLLAHGVVTPVQHLQMQHGIEGIQATVAAAVDAAKAAQVAVDSTKAGTLTAGETTGMVAAVGTAATVGLNAWRNMTRAKVVEKITAA